MKRTHREKELSEVQTLKKENQRLRDENRSLKRQIRQLEKHEHFFTEALDEATEEVNIVERKEACKSCGKGFMKEFIVINRSWKECDVCGERTKAKIKND